MQSPIERPVEIPLATAPVYNQPAAAQPSGDVIHLTN
jgi:hypothetical protein